jgi:DNA-binding NarL/FixJ family response regulator
MTARSDRKTVIEALRCGAHGIVLKSGSARHLMDALQQVSAGGVYISRPLKWTRSSRRTTIARRTRIPLDALGARAPGVHDAG